MVVTFLPATAETGVTHERMGEPSMCTVQAPQSVMPHPNLVPVRPSVSRSTQRSGMAAGASTDCGLPLRVNLTAGMKPSVVRVYQSIGETNRIALSGGIRSRMDRTFNLLLLR